MKPNRKPRINTALLEVLRDRNLDGFSILELRDLFASRHGSEEWDSDSELRKWLYRRVLTLVKNQLITKSKKASNQPARYFKTARFEEVFGPSGLYATTPPLKPSLRDQSAEDARARLTQYEVDMHAYAGECIEYQQLISEHPHLRPEIEHLHQEAKQRSSELLGQIRAITKVLQQRAVS